MKKSIYVVMLLLLNILITKFLSENINSYLAFKTEINEIIEQGKTSVVNISSTSKDIEMYEELTKIKGTAYSQIEQLQGNDYYEPTVFFIDKTYYDFVLKDTGYFNEDDFRIIYDEGITIPAIVSEEFAQEQNLKVGDVTSISAVPPSVCLMNAQITQIDAFNGSSAETIGEKPQKECVENDDFVNSNGMLEYKIKINAIENLELKYFSDTELSSNEIILPFFVLNNANIDFVDIEGYKKFDYQFVTSDPTLIVDYTQITEQELFEAINNIGKKYNSDITISSEVDNKIDIAEENFQIKMQKIIFNYLLVIILFIGSICLVVLYSKTAIQKNNIMKLFGVKKSKILIKNIMPLISVDIALSLFLLSNSLSFLIVLLLSIFQLGMLFICDYIFLRNSIIKIINEEEHVN